MFPGSRAAAAQLPSALYVHGSLVPQAEETPQGLVPERVQAGPILDWSIMHNRDGSATIAVQTKAAFYRLLQPMPAYEALFAQPLLFARACVAMTTVLKQHVEAHMARGSSDAASAQQAAPSAQQAVEAALRFVVHHFGYAGHLARHVHVRILQRFLPWSSLLT